MYYDLLALKEPPMRILYLMARQFHQLLLCETLAEDGFDQKTIAPGLPWRPSRSEKILPPDQKIYQTGTGRGGGKFYPDGDGGKNRKLSDALSVELDAGKIQCLEKKAPAGRYQAGAFWIVYAIEFTALLKRETFLDRIVLVVNTLGLRFINGRDSSCQGSGCSLFILCGYGGLYLLDGCLYS